MAIGTQNLCRLHYLLFYGVFFSLAFNFGIPRQDTMNHLHVAGGNQGTHDGSACAYTQIIAGLFFCLANAFAAAAQASLNAQRKMIQYTAFPLYLGIFYLNRHVLGLAAKLQDGSTGVRDIAQGHVVLLIATALFAIATHSLYISDKRA
jgi:hypothetical protein